MTASSSAAIRERRRGEVPGEAAAKKSPMRLGE
jgi:hypothetical protein